MVFAFDRELERDLWFPILEHHGFENLHSSADEIDFDNAIDAVGYNNLRQQKRFALRTRESQYSVDRLAEYKREFTIRYKGATDEPVEWQKLFEMDLDTLPDYFCYGLYCHRKFRPLSNIRLCYNDNLFERSIPMAKRRKFTAKFKAEVVLEALRGESSQAVLCRRHTSKSLHRSAPTIRTGRLS